MNKKKRLIKTIIISAAVLLLVGVLGGVLLNPYFLQNSSDAGTLAYTDTLTKEKALADVDYVMWQLGKVHPSCVKGMAAEFTEAYERETGRFGETVTVNELNQAIARILSSMHDAHTNASSNQANTRYLLYTAENNDAGLRLDMINGMTMTELFERNKDLFSYETEDYGAERMTWLLARDDGLALLGIDINDKVTYTYSDDEGNVIEKVYGAKDYVPYDEYAAYYGDDLQNDDYSFVRYEIDKDNSLGIFTLDSCINNNEYKRTVDEFFKEVAENGIRNVAVDVRGNGGGNSSVVNYFFRYLDIDSFYTEGNLVRVGPFMFGSDEGYLNKNNLAKENIFTGKLYVMTSISTFSSAMMFAEYVQDNSLGTIVGEASGNDPSGYGDIAIFMTPNAHIYFNVSIKDFTRVDHSKIGQLIMPDAPCESSQALDKVYELIAG